MQKSNYLAFNNQSKYRYQNDRQNNASCHQLLFNFSKMAKVASQNTARVINFPRALKFLV
jgi:hypothetical protein